MEALPGLWSLSPLAALVGVLVLAYWLIATGRLIPKSSHDREIGIYKGTVEKQDKTIELQQAQITSLLEVGTTVQAFLRSAGPPVDENTGRA